MKRIISLLLTAVILLGLSACGSEPAKDNPDPLSIVATIFPACDWVRQILGDEADQAQLTQLLDSGVDLHSFQPTVDDIVRISTCDLFIYVGGESDKWVADALRQAANPNMVVISLMDALGGSVKQEEHKPGMDDHEEADEDEPEYDEHVWLSLRNAGSLCRRICGALCTLDADHADTYRQNTDHYVQKLDELDAQYAQTVENAATKTLLFADRFPFRYLTDDYALDYYAAFSGCSAETEASFETIAFLADKADELHLRAICIIETSDGRIAQTVRDATSARDQAIVTVNSMQSITAKDAENGASYLQLAKDNLEALRQALA